MRLGIYVSLLLLVACSPKQAMLTAPSGFVVNQFELFSLEYSGPKTVVDIVPSGPTEDELACNRAGMAAVEQGESSFKYSFTCLHIMFKGPITKGAVVVQPAGINQQVFEWAAFGIDYAADGTEISGTRNLKGPFVTGDSCRTAAEDLKRDTYETGKVPTDSTLLIYCIPVPVFTDHGGVGDNQA